MAFTFKLEREDGTPADPHLRPGIDLRRNGKGHCRSGYVRSGKGSPRGSGVGNGANAVRWPVENKFQLDLSDRAPALAVKRAPVPRFLLIRVGLA